MTKNSKRIVALPEMYIFFMAMFVLSLACFVLSIVYNVVNYNENDIVIIIILTTIFLVFTAMWPLLGMNIGIFDIVVLNKDNITVVRMGKIIRKVTKEKIESVSIQIVGKGKAIVFDFAEDSYLTDVCLKNKYRDRLLISYTQKRFDDINSRYFIAK